MKGTESHVAQLAVDAISENPALAGVRANLKVKAEPVRVETRLQLLFDLEGRERIDLNHLKTAPRIC